MIEGASIFFGVGAGRCGTMAIANALSGEPGVLCTHEGKVRMKEEPGARILPFLTLENRMAYEWPERAPGIFSRLRGNMPEVGARKGVHHFGDIAYNYAPFIGEITRVFPAARLIAFIRSGEDFVRSATRPDGEDATPVGWPPRGKPLSAVERFVELGRLSPRQHDPLVDRWHALGHLARNAWLWAETNRLILDAIESRRPGSTYVLRFEEFFREPLTSFATLRKFLGLPGTASAAALATFHRPINRRDEKVLGPAESWTPEQRHEFEEFAGVMMRRLGYGPGKESR